MSGLVTLADTKTALGISSTDTERDAMLTRVINAVSHRIRDYTGQHLNLATYTDQWFQPDVVFTRGNPVNSISAASADSGALSVSTDIEFDPETGRIFRLSGGNALDDWRSVAHLEITYSAGYATLPDDLADLVFTGVQNRFEGWLVGTRGLGGQQGAMRVQFPDGGAVNYQTAAALGGGVMDAPDFLLGFPLSMLDAYKDPSPGIAPDASHMWVQS
ncbi:MAG: hypothetical protein CMQ40_12730 [Gammaproteobacteria bacterium]|nr:hypothetical protein [Gammaproteobacteria bacterium]|tara:strand:+ start:502 stop:1152 length:651 start_codon:yes stop_codon:yes gene_type:complete